VIHGTDHDLQLSAADDHFHPPSEDPSWIETFWFAFWVPQTRTTVYVYQWFRPNIGVYGGGVMVWDDQASLPWEIPFFEYQWHEPYQPAAHPDLTNLQLPNGVSLQCLEPLSRYRIGYQHPDLSLDLTFTATMPADALPKGNPPSLFAGHIDQSGHVQGQMQLRGESIPIDCYGFRDRSWGPRHINKGIRLWYCHANAQDSALCTYANPAGSPPGPSVSADVMMGYYHHAGQSAKIIHGKQRIEYADYRGRPWTARIYLNGEDSLGRHFEARGTSVNRFEYTAYPGLLTLLSLTQWDINGNKAWGENHDVWCRDRWAQQLRTDT